MPRRPDSPGVRATTPGERACFTLVKMSCSAIRTAPVMMMPICRLPNLSAHRAPAIRPTIAGGTSLRAATQAICPRRADDQAALREPRTTGSRFGALAAIPGTPRIALLGSLTADPAQASVLRKPPKRPANTSAAQ